MKRRGFLKNVAGLSAGAVLSESYWSQALAEVANDAPVPHRPYNANISLSILGFGGIVVMGQEQRAANREVARAVDRGINYFDVAPTYGRGEAERILGPALKPHRDKVFLAEKTGKRDAGRSREELENSLRVMQTDYFDLYQLHNISKMEDVEEAFGSGGVMETILKARDEGKIRHIGFSSHNEETALHLLDRFEWDSVLFPVYYVCYVQGKFGPRLVAKAKEKGVARLALKALAYTPWESKEEKASTSPKCWYRPINDVEKARAALRFTLSEDVTSAIPPGDETIYRIAENMVARLKPLSRKERADILASADDLQPIFKSALA